MDKTIKEKKRKEKNGCPKCNGNSIAKILWGLPAMSEKLEQQLNEGKVVLGGCCVTDNDPKWHCNNCEYEW